MKKLLPYLETVVNGAQPEGPGLRESLTEMDRIALDPESELAPKLRHYLERRSYSKALEWVREEAGSPGCGQ